MRVQVHATHCFWLTKRSFVCQITFGVAITSLKIVDLCEGGKDKYKYKADTFLHGPVKICNLYGLRKRNVRVRTRIARKKIFKGLCTYL